MRALIKQFMDSEISRRKFVKEMTALGVSLASVEALINSIIPDAHAADETAEAREVTGNGYDLIIETLAAANVKYVFHGCGAGIDKFFDSIVTRPQFQNFLATNEGQCVAMAEGYHIASGGELGVAMVPKPGLGNAAGNIYNARATRSSLLIISARESGEYSERQGDIELVDWQEVMDPFMKWSYRIYSVDRVAEFTRRAIKVALTPPGGPTFLQINEDLHKQETTAKIYPHSKFKLSSKIKADPDAIIEAAKMLIESTNPMITVGHEVTKTGSAEKMIELAELLAIPVTSGLSGFADFPTNHPLYMGRYTPFLGYRRDADLYLSIGSQMPDEGSYVHRGPPPVKAKTIHISLETKLLSLFQPTDLSIVSDVGQAIADLIEAVKSIATKQRLETIRNERYDRIVARIDAARQKTLERAKSKWDQTPMTLARITSELNDALEDDAIIVSEPTPLGAPDWFDLGHGNKTLIRGSGATVLGWATGAALGAKLAQPDKQVVAISGDGAFMFQHSLWSLSRYDAPVIMVVYNNHAYNLNRAYGWLGGGAQAQLKKDLLTYLGDPDVDYSLLAKVYGVAGEKVDNPSELKEGIKRAIQTTKDGRPYLLDVSFERWGVGGDLTWHPEISIADMRTKKV